jgi:DNA-binding transcriptional MerR regulator
VTLLVRARRVRARWPHDVVRSPRPLDPTAAGSRPTRSPRHAPKAEPPVATGRLCVGTKSVVPQRIRIYEARGLLPGTSRSPAGYRLFEEHDIDRLVFIRSARDLGLSLTAIDRVLDEGQAGQRCDTVRALARSRIEEIDATIRRLASIRDGLEQLLAEPVCVNQAGHCPLIEAVASGSGGR